MPSVVQLQPLDIGGSSRSPANSALGLGSSRPLHGPYNASNNYKFDYASYGQLSEGPDRKAKSASRKRVERVVHERAPQLATLVAGHGDGSLLQAAKERAAAKVASAAATAKGKGKSKSGKRYSSSEIRHLVPDESGELHDPEYESFRMVKQPSAQRSSARGSDDEGEDGKSEDGSESTSSSEYEDEGGGARSTGTELMNGVTSLQRPLPGSSGSRRVTSNSSLQPSRSYRTSAHSAASSAVNYRGTPQHPTPAGITSLLSGSRMSSNTSERSSDKSAGGASSNRRTYGGSGATYLAPSITMPPTASSYASTKTVQPQAYNPYTYVPTTVTPAAAYSHETRVPGFGTHASRRQVAFAPQPSSSRQQAQSNASLYRVNSDGSGPVSESIREEVEEEETFTAPPIAWHSTFTPSAEHPERHRTRQHEANAGLSIKRSFQAAKLDVTFGLLRLGSKKK